MMNELRPSLARRTPAPRVPRTSQAGDDLAVRIAVIDDGRIVDERTFAKRHVTIGEEPGCDLHVAGLTTHRLFERAGRGYRVKLPRGVTGRADKQAIHGKTTIPLGVRGSLEVGLVRLLFQVVARPAEVEKAVLPPQFKKPAMGGVDWFTTVAAAFSFLFHFLAVAAVYSDFSDPVVDDIGAIHQITALVEVAHRPLIAPPLDQPADSAAPAASGAAAASGTSAAAKATPGGSPGGHATQKGPATEKGGGDPNARAAELAAQLAALDVHTLMGLREGLAAGDVFDPGVLPPGFGDPSRPVKRGDEDPFGLKPTGEGQGNDMRPGDKAGDGRAPTKKQAADAEAEKAGEQVAVKGPNVSANASGGDTSEGRTNIPGADGVIARMRGRLRACYLGGLERDPTLQGSVSLVASIAANGSVSSVGGGGGPLAPIMGCLKAVVQSGQFAAPRDGRGVVMVSINFVRLE
jgi:hypothetical protein